MLTSFKLTSIHGTQQRHVDAREKNGLQRLRQKYPVFVYDTFSWKVAKDGLKVCFKFTVSPELIFEPYIIIEGVSMSHLKDIPVAIIDNLCFHLGLVEMISYWKATCSPEILILAGFLNSDQVVWWKDLIMHGMGEYFFINDIDFTRPDLISVSVHHPPRSISAKYERIPTTDKNLVLTSGGKDTALTLSIFSSERLPFNSLILNPGKAALDLAHAAGNDNPIIVRREIVPKLIELNNQGYLNGHTPFSAYLAFLGVTCASLFGYDKVIVSNERSSDEGNVQFHEKEINHQYSKTLSFERKFQQYTENYLNPHVRYFSFLRPLFDIQIMRLLASNHQALGLFRSCNRNQKENTWCGRCPKCLSVYTMLYPFAEYQLILLVFGQDFFKEIGNIEILQELAGVKGHKPFECVGTRREIVAALYLGLEKAREDQKELPALWRYVESEILPHYGNLQKLTDEVLLAWGDTHSLSIDYENILKRHFEHSVEEHLSYGIY